MLQEKMRVALNLFRLSTAGTSCRADCREWAVLYDKDPAVHADATRFAQLSHLEVIQRGLKVMDSTAISLCMDNELPIVVFKMEPGSVVRVVSGEAIGTAVG